MKNYAILARAITGLMLIIVWGLTDGPLSGVSFLLILTATAAARYRFKAFASKLSAVEVIISAAYAFVWLPAFLGLFMPVIGLLENKWDEREKELLKQDHEDRARRLSLERERENALKELQNVKRQTEINERARIAQDIHDHVGHEVSGALLALQAAIKLCEADDSQAAKQQLKRLLTQSVERLKSASENLRESVHNLKPVNISGAVELSEVETLSALCDSFSFCDVKLSVTEGLTLTKKQGELLGVNLKEALTNVSRHSNATLVKISLDQNADYIRMIICDNGDNLKTKSFRSGLGLSGMKERARAAGGTLAVSYDNGFKIICTLPKKGGTS